MIGKLRIYPGANMNPATESRLLERMLIIVVCLYWAGNKSRENTSTQRVQFKVKSKLSQENLYEYQKIEVHKIFSGRATLLKTMDIGALDDYSNNGIFSLCVDKIMKNQIIMAKKWQVFSNTLICSSSTNKRKSTCTEIR